MKHLSRTLLFTVPLVALAQPAHAYLDPGTGSVILQAVLAGVAGVTIVARMYLHKIKGFFKRKPTPPVDPAHEEPQPQTDA